MSTVWFGIAGTPTRTRLVTKEVNFVLTKIAIMHLSRASLKEAVWFKCPNCGFPLRGGFLECPMCECLFLFQGEEEPSQSIPKALATLKAYAGPARGVQERAGAAAPRVVPLVLRVEPPLVLPLEARLAT